MSGILFLKTQKPADLNEFYLKRLGCELWLAQEDCRIYRHGNFLFGFCQRDAVDREAMLTFFFDRPTDIDTMYEKFSDCAVERPTINDKYRIYHFFAKDPEGRTVEFQCFNHQITEFMAGDQLLLSRRSQRKFEEREISDEILHKVLELSRFAPTARNTQSYYFKFIRDLELIHWLSETRGSSTKPIGNARIAVAICADPAVSNRYIQDGCIAAYHFILAAWFYGLGTCWIAAMDRDDIKEKLKIPLEHYIATITPLGYPVKWVKDAPERKTAREYIRE
ncbi:MAG: nitroreductase family protein [Candidatus Zixiibacteriota bacterium]